MKQIIQTKLKQLVEWSLQSKSTPSYMVYLGRSIPPNEYTTASYVSDISLNIFLNEQPYFDSFTIWKAEGSWRGDQEDTCIVEVFDTDFDIIVMFAQKYRSDFNQEAVYIKTSETITTIIDGENL